MTLNCSNSIYFNEFQFSNSFVGLCKTYEENQFTKCSILNAKQFQKISTFKHFFINSKTFEALNFCFQIQGLSRIFKFCTNPGKRSILLACDWGEISKQRRVTVAMHMHKTCTNTVPTSQAYRQNLSFKFWFTLIFNLFSTVWTYCSVAQVSCNICNAWLYVNYALYNLWNYIKKK